MICELTAMEIANASLLDEGTAAAVAMVMAVNALKFGKGREAAGPSYYETHPELVVL